MQFYSRFGQDKFLFERFFLGKRNGTFVDIGAHDGKTRSNTLFFEQSLGWSGLCVEPLSIHFKKLQACRIAVCVNCIVSDLDSIGDPLDVTGDTKTRTNLIEDDDQRRITVIGQSELTSNGDCATVKTFSNVLRSHNLTKVDYCSIHAEGTELSILKSLDFDQYDVALFTIQNACHDGRIEAFLAGKEYALVATLEGHNQIYAKKHMQMLPRTTVICAVWHGDPHRLELLAGHSANLDKQTRAIERVYVFDGGDTPALDVKGHIVITREKLSVYQAWNIAISVVRTPYVMNLNLDDRLAPDAVAVMENALDRGGDLVGGDWKVCYTQDDTDAVMPSFRADTLPVLPAWPPPAGAFTRLGSGTGTRGTLGPACMWRTSLHQSFAKFPQQFGDGTLIRVIGDAVWWCLLAQNNKKVKRVPIVVGNYHSHPKDQAEFRNPAINEEQKFKAVGVRLL